MQSRVHHTVGMVTIVEEAAVVSRSGSSRHPQRKSGVSAVRQLSVTSSGVGGTITKGKSALDGGRAAGWMRVVTGGDVDGDRHSRGALARMSRNPSFLQQPAFADQVEIFLEKSHFHVPPQSAMWVVRMAPSGTHATAETTLGAFEPQPARPLVGCQVASTTPSVSPRPTTHEWSPRHRVGESHRQ